VLDVSVAAVTSNDGSGDGEAGRPEVFDREEKHWPGDESESKSVIFENEERVMSNFEEIVGGARSAAGRRCGTPGRPYLNHDLCDAHNEVFR
jgi:hypothetical protein